jgi:hypothetical protein
MPRQRRKGTPEFRRPARFVVAGSCWTSVSRVAFCLLFVAFVKPLVTRKGVGGGAIDVPRAAILLVRTARTSSRFGRRFLSLAIESGKTPAESEMYELVMLGRLADESEGRELSSTANERRVFV